MLDIHTPKGKISRKQEDRAYQIIEEYGPIKFIHTDKDNPEEYDADVCLNGKRIATVETKCRELDPNQFTCGLTKRIWGELATSWLITYEKIKKCQEKSKEFGVPFYGLLYSVPSDRVLLIQITDRNGDFVLDDFYCSRTLTQSSINGGDAYRLNMYIPLSKAMWSPNVLRGTIADMVRGGNLADTWAE